MRPTRAEAGLQGSHMYMKAEAMLGRQRQTNAAILQPLLR